MRNLFVLLCGIVFGLGLGYSGMVSPDKVQSFLDLAGFWDPSLGFVMIGAIGVAAPGFWMARHKLLAPFHGESFSLPTKSDIDHPLILGAIIFGIGWALAGICPGPALANLSKFEPKLLVFLATMLLGLFFADLLTRKK